MIVDPDEQQSTIVASDPAIELATLRRWIGELTQPIPDGLSTVDGFRRLVDKLRFVETAWQQAVDRYMAYERAADLQRRGVLAKEIVVEVNLGRCSQCGHLADSQPVSRADVVNCPCNDDQPCPDPQCAHTKGEPAPATSPAPKRAS